jgi:hypothetical protein
LIGACNTLWEKTGYVGCLPFSCPLMKSSAPCGCPVPSSKKSCHWVCLSRVVASSMNCCMEPIPCTWLLVNAAPVPTTLSRLSPPTLGSRCPAACWASSPRGATASLSCASTPAMWFDSRSHGFVLLFCTRSKRLGNLCSQALCTLPERLPAVRHRPFYRFSINLIE